MPYPLPHREPNLCCDILKIWVIGRQFPEASDYWDGNWLNVVAHCAAEGASVTATGSILHLGELSQWRDALAKMDETVAGTAELPTIEPNLRLELTCDKNTGQVRGKCEITPDHMTQQHVFELGLDQSYLRPLISQCDDILREYPLRDAEPR
jgi:hypothetical protein